MRIQTNTPIGYAVAFHAARPRCPRCGDNMLAPEIAEFAGRGHIRHTWMCDECDYVFCTSIELDLD